MGGASRWPARWPRWGWVEPAAGQRGGQGGDGWSQPLASAVAKVGMGGASRWPARWPRWGWGEPAAGQRGGQGGDGGRAAGAHAVGAGGGTRTRRKAARACGLLPLRPRHAAGTVPVPPPRSTCALAAAPHRTAPRAQDAASGRTRFVSSLGPSIVDLAVDELVVKVGAGHRCRGARRRLLLGWRLIAAGGRGGRQVGRQSGRPMHASRCVDGSLAHCCRPPTALPTTPSLARRPQVVLPEGARDPRVSSEVPMAGEPQHETKVRGGGLGGRVVGGPRLGGTHGWQPSAQPALWQFNSSRPPPRPPPAHPPSDHVPGPDGPSRGHAAL